MGTLGDSGLIPQGKAGLWGVDDDVVEDSSYELVLNNVVDASGDPLDFTGVTAYCFASDKVGGVTVLTFDCAWSTVDSKTRLTISKDGVALTGLALGRKNRHLVWELWLDDGTPDTFPIWAAHDSNLIIHGRG